MANQPLYELTPPTTLKPLGRHLYIARDLINRIQRNWATFAPQTKQRVRQYLRAKGAVTHVLTVTDQGYKGGTKFFKQVEEALKESHEVWMCMGELGFRMMEREEILAGIKAASEKNGASIKIVHGPRTDPKTSRVFELAKQGKVKLYPLEYYPSHHFMYMVSTTGKPLLIEESPHIEPVRARDKEGAIIEFYRSFHRVFYYIQNPNWLGRRRLKQAEQRVWQSNHRRSHRTVQKERGYPLFRILFTLLFIYVPYTFITQPIMVLFDRLDLSWNNLVTKFRGILAQGASEKGVRRAKMNKESSKAEQVDKEHLVKQSNGEKAPIEELPVEELTKLIKESSDLAIRIGATHELIRRVDPT